MEDGYLEKRNITIIENYCALTYPEDIFKSMREDSHLLYQIRHNYAFRAEVLLYFWKVVKKSALCCCVSKFFCTSSTNLDKCLDGCCGKCKAELPAISDTLSESSESSDDESSSASESSSSECANLSEDNLSCS